MRLSPVLLVIEKLKKNIEKDEEWKRLKPEHKSKFDTFVVERDEMDEADDIFSLDNAGFDKRKLWNIANDAARKKMAKDPHQIHSCLGEIFQRLRMWCLLVETKFVGHVKEAKQRGQDPRALDLLRFYGTFKSVSVPRASRQSEGAVSNPDDCRTSIVGASLKADQIHHNMFQDHKQLSFQKFKRFEIGGQRERDQDDPLETLIDACGLAEKRDELERFLPAARANLDCARSFLSGCVDPGEMLTQYVFDAFLADLVDKMDTAFLLRNEANVVVVAGMDTVDIPVNICEKYMHDNAAKRGARYAGEGKNTTLKIKSDVAIFGGPSNQYRRESPGAQQKKMFLNCLVNVEMKKWDSLANSKNKSPLTQVAAESMVRSMALEGDGRRRGSLFSLLTDCGVLYCLVHKVDVREYWISRSIDTSEEIVLSICWLYLCARGLVEANVSSWEYRDATEHGLGNYVDEKETESDLASVDEEHDDGHYGEAGGGPVLKGANQNCNSMHNLPVVSFDKMEEEEEEEEERKMWQRIFLMENHRKYGTPLPLTEDFLSLHDARTQLGAHTVSWID